MSHPHHPRDAAVFGTEDDQVRRCAYFVPRKKRKCRMMVKEGNEYCGEHAVIKVEESPLATREGKCGDNTRIFCPYDPKHTCSKRRLKRHLNACPARPQSMPKYHTKGINTEETDYSTSRTKRTINDISEERLANLVTKVNAVFEHLAPLPAEHLSHPVIMCEAESGAAARDNG